MGGPESEDSSVVSSSRFHHQQRGKKLMAVESPLFDTVVVLDRLPGCEGDRGAIQKTF